MNQPIPLDLDSPGQGSPVELGVPRQIWRLSQVAAVLIVAITLPQAMGVVASWQAYGRLDTLSVGPLQTQFVSSADGLALVATLSVVLMIAATVSLLMWVWRARQRRVDRSKPSLPVLPQVCRRGLVGPDREHLVVAGGAG